MPKGSAVFVNVSGVWFRGEIAQVSGEVAHVRLPHMTVQRAMAEVSEQSPERWPV